ncbi:pilus assembly protein [Thermocrinis sp.]
MIRRVLLLGLVVLISLSVQKSYSANMADYCYVPPAIGTSVPPNVMIMLSIETPMQGSAHPPIQCSGDPRTSYSCGFKPPPYSYVVSGRIVDNNYDNSKEYYGYFDPNKCYIYVGGGTGGRFEPYGPAVNHQCSGKWSGNFLNWATMMAVDAFRKAMTGGNRAVDSPGSTQLLGARQTLDAGHPWFPIKRIDNANLYTPYSGTIYLIRYANGFVVCRDTNNDGLPDCGVGESGSGENLFPVVSNRRCSNDIFKACSTDSDCPGGTCQTVTGGIASFNLKIEVCNPSKGLESNCNPANNKPEGVIQKYADKMRFGLISYAMYNNPDGRRDGGVLRANVKWISHKIPYGYKYHDANGDLVVCTNTNGCPNPEAEINADGTFITNPDNIGGASYSGVINYINKFGYISGYKTYDPISEMYYEIVRYFKKLGPSTDNYCNGLPTIDDGAPVLCSFSPWSHTNKLGWRDPYIYPCQKSFVLAINDANPSLDKRIPGTAKTSDSPCIQCVGDYGAPSNADTTINVSYWTDLVGNYEGITPGNMCIGCVLGGACDWNANPKYVSRLSQAFGTCPWPPKENSYYIAGLAYYAHQTDLRADLPGSQTLKTYMIDTQEATSNMLVGRYNMLYLAAKFGNFDDTNNNGRPDISNEWDKDGDGFPDAYFFASDPTKIEESLIKAFADILRRASAGATVATLTSRASVSSVIVQPYFYPKYTTADGREISWIGFLRSFWVDTKQNLREDTTGPKILNLAGTLFDKIFQFFFDSSSGETKVVILQESDISSSCTRESVRDFNQVKSVFDSSCQLALTSPQDRRIFYNKSGNLQPFQTGSTDIRDIFRTVDNTIDQTKADCIVRYIRGENLSSDSTCGNLSYVRRVREFDTTTFSSVCPGYSSSSDVTWKLGDIYASTPSVAGPDPLNIYHLRYADSTYLNYIRSNQYKNRHSLLFVGANDGMLHAFRIGHVKETGDPNTPVKLINAPDNNLTDLIGREEWAFIPRNAIPYLVWYGREDYCRVPTVDYRTYVFDASIGGPANASKDANSWRTILVGTMGFGGRELGTYSSSVFALDITDFSNPRLLWEVPLPDKTLTTSHPAVVRLGDRNKNGEWYIVIGTGPRDPAGESFINTPGLYIIDLRDGTIVKTIDVPIPNNVSAAVGDIAVVDVDNDYQDDAIYFGLYGKDNSGKTWGNFYRLSLRSGNTYRSVSGLSSSDICNVLDLGTFATAGHSPPVFGAANFTKDENNKLWIFFGTGRYLSQSDKTIPYKNYLIGFKDDHWNGASCSTYRKGDLDDVTNSTINAVVSEIRQMCMCDSAGCGMQDVVYNTLSSFAPTEPTRGWYHELTNEGIYSQPLVLGGVVDALIFVPPQDICEFGGSSNLIAVYYKTGTPYPRPSVLSPGAVSGTIRVGENVSIMSKISVGPGMPPLGNPFQALQSSTRSEGSEKFVQVGTGIILRFSQQSATEVRDRFLLWIEK